ncbi:MAG: YfhO family protein [Gemmatimonadaceae bacterium]
MAADTAEQTVEPAARTDHEGPRLAGVWAGLTYAVCALALGYPALLGKFLVNPLSDQYKAGYAFREYAAATLRSTGHFPLWNPYLFGGMPYVDAMHGDIFYPTFLLRLVLPTDVAMTWGFIIHVFLAGLFTYYLLRAYNLSFFASLIGGIAYMMGGNVAALVAPGHDGKVFVSAMLPAVLICVTRLVRDGKLWASGALAFAVGMAVLSPHPQLLQYLLLVAGAFALLLSFTALGGTGRSRAVVLRRLGIAGAAIAVGLSIGAIQFLPLRQYTPWSPRATGKGWEAATEFSMPPEEAINFALPEFSGILEKYWGRNGIHYHSEYIGIVVLLLAALAIGRSASNERRLLTRFFGGAAAVTLLWAFGGYTPFYRLVYAIVPGTKFFRAPSTMLFAVSFCTAVLAALGAERAFLKEVHRRRLMISLMVVGGVALLGITGALMNLGLSISALDSTDRVLANASAVRVGAFRMFVFGALTVTTLFLIETDRLSRDMRGILLAALVATDIWTVVRRYWMFSEPASVIFATDPAVDAIMRDSVPGRVLAVQLGPTTNPYDAYLGRDALMVHRIRNVLGYHGNELGRYELLGDFPNGWRQIGNPNFWRLANVRYLLTNTDSVAIPSLKKVVGPVRNASGNDVTLFKVTEDNPLAWVTPAIVKAGDESVLATVLDPRFDVRTAALFDSSAAGVQGRDLRALPPALDLTVRTTLYSPGHIVLELSGPAPEGSALIVSENYYPGWRALVDGKPAVTARADMTLIGVPLTAGARKIELTFTDAAFETGKTVTLLAIGLSLLMWVGGNFAGRSRLV